MNSRSLGWIVALFAVVGIIWFAMNKGTVGGVSSTDYKAVFLTNGQVYFGKVANEAADPVVMTDIYYLQVQQQLQQATKAGEQPTTTQQIQLIKLGNEIHGPKDEMRINHSQLLYVETLKEDGQVVKTIREYQKNGGKASATTPAPAESTPASSPSTKK